MKITHLISYALFLSLPFYAQKNAEGDKPQASEVVVKYDAYMVKAQLPKKTKKVKTLDDRTYLSYSDGKILETKGNYDGDLLDGYYKSFYAANGQLSELGRVKYGLRAKVWHSWYLNGKPKEIIGYKQGKKSGKYRLYSESGLPMAEGHFKKDLLEGAFYTYNNKGTVREKKMYKHGKEIVRKAKAEKVEKINLAPEKEKRPAPANPPTK